MPPTDHQPPFTQLPPRFVNTAYADLPPALKARVDSSLTPSAPAESGQPTPSTVTPGEVTS